MKEPSQRAQAILARYKAAQALPAETKAQVLDAVRTRALRGDLPRFDIQTTAPVVPESGLLRALWSSPLAKLGLGLLFAGPVALGVVALRKAAPVTAPPPPRQQAVPAASIAPSAATATPLLEPLGSVVSAPAGSAPRPAKLEKQVAPASPSAGEATIDEEVQLIKEAQAALRAGDATGALARTDEHSRRFPTGKLASARAVTRMMALCQAGRQDQARLEADRFLAAHPGSPYADRVKGICAPRKP
jgi:hypothetical protein